MALLRSTVTQAGTTGAVATYQSLGRFTAPADQKVVVWPTIHFKDTGSAVFIQTELRRGMTGGTLGSAVTPVKANVADTEDIRSTFQPFSVNPTDNGSVVDRADVRSDRSYSFPPVTLNENETLDVVVTNANAKAYVLVIKSEE